MSKIMPKSIEDFELKKVIFHEKKVEIEAINKVVRDDQGKSDELGYTMDAIPHQDLVDIKNSLKKYLLMAYGIQQAHERAMGYAMKGKIESIENDLLDFYQKVEVTRISIAGEKQLRGVVISGKIKSFNDSKIALNTPRIVFSSDKLGFEEDVEAAIEGINQEIWLMMTEGKRAAASLFDGHEEEELEEEKEVEAPVGA